VSAGANVKAVQHLLGHASAAMTLDVYSGLFGDDLDGVAERIDSLPGVSNLRRHSDRATESGEIAVTRLGSGAALGNRTPDLRITRTPSRVDSGLD
jgi:hypothetical protein